MNREQQVVLLQVVVVDLLLVEMVDLLQVVPVDLLLVVGRFHHFRFQMVVVVNHQQVLLRLLMVLGQELRVLH